MVFIKKGDVWMAKDNGSRQVAITVTASRAGRTSRRASPTTGRSSRSRASTCTRSSRTAAGSSAARQWAINPSPTLSTEPFTVDLSPNGRIVATHNGSTRRTTTRARRRPVRRSRRSSWTSSTSARTRRSGRRTATTTTALPHGSDRVSVLTTSYGGLQRPGPGGQGRRRDAGRRLLLGPGRFPNTGMNTHILADAEATRAGDRFAVMRRPLLGADADDPSVATIQIYRTGSPSTASTPICTIGPGRRIGYDADPSWSSDGRRLLWWERGRGDLLHAGHRRSRLRPEAQAHHPRRPDPGSQPRTPAATLRSRTAGGDLISLPAPRRAADRGRTGPRHQMVVTERWQHPDPSDASVSSRAGTIRTILARFGRI